MAGADHHRLWPQSPADVDGRMGVADGEGLAAPHAVVTNAAVRKKSAWKVSSDHRAHLVKGTVKCTSLVGESRTSEGLVSSTAETEKA